MKRYRYFRIRITRTGYLFIALCLGVGIAGLNTGNNLLYLLFSMMLSFIILSGLLSNNTLTKLFILPVFPKRIFANREVPVNLTLENRKRWLPSFSLLLFPEGRRGDKPGAAYVMKVPAGRSASAVDLIRFRKRGKTPLPAYVVETSYPFGLIRKYTSVPGEGETIVYPELLPIQPRLLTDMRALGEFLSGQRGGASNPYGLRDLTYGDPARLIHWKTSARAGKLKVKEFEREKKLRITLAVRLAPARESDPGLREKAVSLAASLLLFFTSQGFEVSLDVNGEPVEPKGRGFLDAYLTALALAQAPSHPLPALRVKAQEGVVLITDGDRQRLPRTPLLVYGPKEIRSL
ncbi:MAG: DUF58 domain-containing protein [Pseudomonadota bacterium]